MEEEFWVEVAALTDPVVLRCTAHAPYSGCFYEPNYYLLKEGNVYPIYVSGTLYKNLGYDKLGSAHDVIMHPIELRDFMDRVQARAGGYDEWKWGRTEEASPGANWLNSMTAILYMHEVPTPKWNCSECGREHQGIAKFLGYTGNGSIGIRLTHPCCSECFDNLSYCSICCSDTDGDYCAHCEDNVETYPADDYAEQFGLDGSRYLTPGYGEGPLPVLVIMTKGDGDAGDVSEV